MERGSKEQMCSIKDDKKHSKKILSKYNFESIHLMNVLGKDSAEKVIQRLRFMKNEEHRRVEREKEIRSKTAHIKKRTKTVKQDTANLLQQKMKLAKRLHELVLLKKKLETEKTKKMQICEELARMNYDLSIEVEKLLRDKYNQLTDKHSNASSLAIEQLFTKLKCVQNNYLEFKKEFDKN